MRCANSEVTGRVLSSVTPKGIITADGAMITKYATANQTVFLTIPLMRYATKCMVNMSVLLSVKPTGIKTADGAIHLMYATAISVLEETFVTITMAMIPQLYALMVTRVVLGRPSELQHTISAVEPSKECVVTVIHPRLVKRVVAGLELYVHTTVCHVQEQIILKT